MNKHQEYVKNTLDERELLEQLSEEASELSKAALKLIRAKGYSKNPTPVTEEEAVADLIEEYNDVLGVAEVLGLERDMGIKSSKSKRWAKRIREYVEKGMRDNGC